MTHSTLIELFIPFSSGIFKKVMGQQSVFKGEEARASELSEDLPFPLEKLTLPRAM
jgi:hypothetical protein